MITVRLTPAQRRLLPFIREGLQYRVIAERLHLSVGTVKNAVHAIAEKLDSIEGVPPYRRVQQWAIEHPDI